MDFTTLLDGTVVKLCFGVSRIAPGPMLISIWIPTVVLCQVGLRVCLWVDPGGTRDKHESTHATGSTRIVASATHTPRDRSVLNLVSPTWFCEGCSRSISGRRCPYGFCVPRLCSFYHSRGSNLVGKGGREKRIHRSITLCPRINVVLRGLNQQRAPYPQLRCHLRSV